MHFPVNLKSEHNNFKHCINFRFCLFSVFVQFLCYVLKSDLYRILVFILNIVLYRSIKCILNRISDHGRPRSGRSGDAKIALYIDFG